MKNRYKIFIISICCLFISSCSADNDLLKRILLGDNTQYNEYLLQSEQYKADIDDSGMYHPAEVKETIAPAENHNGSIHVSFANNSLLNISYYYDADHSEAIDTYNCTLNPGDTIYANIAIKGTAQSNTYEFKGFEIRFLEDNQILQNRLYNEGDAIQIPEDIVFSEICIIPNGHYKNRELLFSAECKDDDDSVFSVNPVWTVKVNGQEYKTKSDSYSIGATSPFRVEATFDPSKYYLIEDECEPKIESVSDKFGTVTYKQYDPQTAENEYSLVFGRKHEFQIDSIISTGNITITVNGEIFDDPEFPFTFYAKLKDQVEIETTGEITEINGVQGLERQDINGYVYKIVNNDGIIDFDPSSYKYPHGKVSFYNYEHKEINGKTKLNVGDYIYYIGKPDEGYSFSMPEGENRYKIDLDADYFFKNELKFTSKQRYDLPQPNLGGTITYYLNGEEVETTFAYITANVDKLTASFTPDNRYVVNNMSDQAECVISDDGLEIRFMDNSGNVIGIDDIFRYSDSQKAVLKVTVDKNVGTEPQFYIYSGTNDVLNEDQKSFIPADWNVLGSDPRAFDDGILLENEKIQTDAGIKISVSDWSPLKNEAMRLRVIKTDNSNAQTTEIFYILAAGGSCFIDTDSGDSIYYKSIEINISRVTGSVFDSKDYVYENAVVSFNYDDTTDKEPLKDGEFVDDSRTIHMSITAKSSFTLYKQKDIRIPWDNEKYEVKSQYEDTFAFSQIAEKYSAMKQKTKIE